MAGGNAESKSATLVKTAYPRIEAISAWEAAQKRTDERLGKLETIFVESGLAQTRRGKNAWAEEAESLIITHQFNAFSSLREKLTSEGMDRMLRKGDWLLESFGYKGPLNPIEVMGLGTTGALMQNLERAVRSAEKSQGLSPEDKKLVAVAAREIEIGMAGEVTSRHQRNYKLTAILHPVLRRGKAREEEAKIEAALQEFGKACD